MASFFSRRRAACLRVLIPLDGLGCLLILMRDEPDRPLGQFRQRHQLAQRIKHLLELGAGVAAKGVMLHRQQFGLVLQLVELLGLVLVCRRHGAHLHKRGPGHPAGT